MDALGDLAEQTFEFGRRGEVASFRCLAVRLLIRLACLFAGLLRLLLRRSGRIKPRVQLRDSRHPFIQFGVERANLPQVASLKSCKLTAKIDQL